MNTAMRGMATFAAALFLITHVGAADAQESSRPRTSAQPMSPSESARLTTRAAKNPELEQFTGGQAEVGMAYALAFVCVAAFSVAVGHLIAFPLGVVHASQGKTFVPADSLKGNPGAVSYFNVCGAILGFPLYSLGYLAGLPCAPGKAPVQAPPTEDRRLEIFVLGLTEEGPDGHLRLAGASRAADYAGLQPGDLILDINGVEVTRDTLSAVLAKYQRVEAVEVGVLRDGCLLRLAVATED